MLSNDVDCSGVASQYRLDHDLFRPVHTHAGVAVEESVEFSSMYPTFVASVTNECTLDMNPGGKSSETLIKFKAVIVDAAAGVGTVGSTILYVNGTLRTPVFVYLTYRGYTNFCTAGEPTAVRTPSPTDTLESAEINLRTPAVLDSVKNVGVSITMLLSRINRFVGSLRNKLMWRSFCCAQVSADVVCVGRGTDARAILVVPGTSQWTASGEVASGVDS